MPVSLFDTSVWVAAVFSRHPAHVQAQTELAGVTAGEPAAFCRATQQSFLRLITTPQLLRLYDAEGFTNQAAMETLQLLRMKPEITEIDEPPGTVELWHQLAARETASPKVWMDAYLAAFAISGALRFVTLDRDFKCYEARRLQLVLLHP